MFHWKIILILVVLKILSIIIAHYYYSSKENNKDNQLNNMVEFENEIRNEYKNEIENKMCMTLTQRNFMICWIKYTMDMIDCSKAIIKNLPNLNNYYSNLTNTKEEMFGLFAEIHKNDNEHNNLVMTFNKIINQQISIKISLCYAIKNDNKEKISQYSKLLITNTQELGFFFGKIKKNKQTELELTKSLSTHTNLYIKTCGTMKKVADVELTRQLILGSIDIVKLLL
jgi:hypothetical protein